MIETKPGTSTRTPYPKGKASFNGELSRLVTAAVVNQKFCNLLLASPTAALSAGYNGESFNLTLEERELVVSIRASSLTDFATQLTVNGHNHPSHRL
jgi:hypothetical protein